VLKNNKFTFYNLLKITYNFNYDLLFEFTFLYTIFCNLHKNMIQNILLLILYCLEILALFALFIFDLNILIFIINEIILLNVLFVVSYYFYNLLKNSIF